MRCFAAARLTAFALAATAATATGCRRSPFAAPPDDAGSDRPVGVPSIGDAAREPQEANMETPTALPPGDASPEVANADAHVGADADATKDASANVDGPTDLAEHDVASPDAPIDVAAQDAAANDVAPSDRVPTDGADARLEDQPCGPQRFNCAPFACDVARGICKSTCATNDDCVTGQACNPVGLCGLRDDLRCTSDDECLSGHCAQGVCCNSACTGPCVSCGLPGSLGTCAAVTRGVLDPSGICGAAGTCNGRGGCVPVTCAADTDCGDLYLCNDAHCTACNATCTTSAACVAPAVCVTRNFCSYCGIPDGGAGS